MNLIRNLTIATLIALLSACGMTNILDSNSDGTLQKMKADALYQAGDKALAAKQYPAAIRYFEALDTQYPFSKYEEQNQLNLIFAYYKSGDHPSAAAAATRFIHLHPRSKHADYAHYMKAVANSEITRGIISQYLPIDRSQRDLSLMHTAYEDFAAFLRLFPKSPFAADTKRRMIYLRNIFASHEYKIADYYYQRRDYVASANRLSHLIETYPSSPETEKALVLLIKANQKLGLTQTAHNAQMVLQTNFPNHQPKMMNPT